MLDTRSVVELVTAANADDRSAWDTLVERYSSLVVGVASTFRLGANDVADVHQTVWLRLVESLGSLREPRALPGWLVTTTRNECLRSIRLQRRTVSIDPSQTWDMVLVEDRDAALDEHLLREERREAVREAFATLPEHCRRLLALMVTDPPATYEEMSRRLEMPHGSIGPTRARCLGKLRRCPALTALVGTSTDTPGRSDDAIGTGRRSARAG